MLATKKCKRRTSCSYVTNKIYVLSTAFLNSTQDVYTPGAHLLIMTDILRKTRSTSFSQRINTCFIKSLKIYLGAEANSDHNSVVMDKRLRLFARFKCVKETKHNGVRNLNNPMIRIQAWMTDEIIANEQNKRRRVILR